MASENQDSDAPKTDAPKRPIDPLEEVSLVREEVRKRLKPSDEYQEEGGVEQNIRAIRMILATNQDIFDRCTVHMTKGDSTTASGNYMKFTRYSYDVVETYPLGCWGFRTQIITCPVRSHKTFEMHQLSVLPASLDNLIMPKKRDGPFSVFIDYESFFQSSLVLHEKVLGPFLAKLKDHLMSVQVCLGMIDEWLLEAQSNIYFLEDTFGVKMERPESDTEDLQKKCDCQSGTHSDSLKCKRCSCQLSEHNNKICPGFSSQSFQCNKFQVLKVCDNNKTPGSFETSFRISDGSQRAKLAKFLEFMEME